MEYRKIIKPPQSKVLKSGRVILKPGEDVGEHVTEKKEELIIVLNGTATILKNEKETIVKENETFFIEEGMIHNIFNRTKSDLEYIYVVSLFE